MITQRSNEGFIARGLAVAAVVGVATGIAVLVVSAYGHTTRTASVGSAAPIPTFTLGVPTPAPTAMPTPLPSPDSMPTAQTLQAPTASAEAPPVVARDAERFLTAGSGAGSGVWWRAVAGECGRAQPLVERSTDGGATWRDTTPLSAGIGQIASLDAFQQVQAELVAGIGPSCEPQALRTYSEGEFWESYPDVLSISRYVQLSNPAVVATINGSVNAPCADARSLRARGDLVALVCDHVAYVADSSGAWNPLPTVDAVAVGVALDGVVVAHVEDLCSGLALTRYVAGDPAQPVAAGCATQADALAPTAVAASADGLLVWSGDSLSVVP